ncbi:MAG TPA: hypothetical protein VGO55_16940 [Allosphingosinicella sp.]|jgi:hypothetical protein|nr:hypothetical protein [Allosphingosinicella sp.]
MTLRIKLLAAAAFALPASMASAQQTAPTAPPPPMGGTVNPATQANVPPQPVVPPAETPVPSAAQPAETVPDVAEEAADAVEADAVAQTRVQAAAQGETPTATTPPPAAPAAPVQAQAQPPATPAPAQPAASAGAIAQATPADLRAGVQVHDESGGLVGTVETADAGGAVINTGVARARIVLSSFGRNNRGLVISMTKAQFEAAASAANPS